MDHESYDLIPVPQAATIEIGTSCERRCAGCAFQETPLETLDVDDINHSIHWLSQYWDYVGNDPEHQLIGERIVELIGGAGVFNRMSFRDIDRLLKSGVKHKLHQLAVMCDARYDKNAIWNFFESAKIICDLEKSKMKAVVALSVDSLPKGDIAETHREQKSEDSWQMLANRKDFIKDPETQNFRIFTTISKRNFSEISDIAKRVLESGAMLFIAPLTIHSKELLANTGVSNRLLMGTDTDILLDETDREKMEAVVKELRILKTQYPELFLNSDETFDNMISACKPLVEGFRQNCRERCAFVAKGGEKLIATPNFRIMRRPGMTEKTLGICTCMVGPTDGANNYANIRFSDFDRIVSGDMTTLDLYRKLTADLVKMNCPGCNTRTSINIREEGLK